MVPDGSLVAAGTSSLLIISIASLVTTTWVLIAATHWRGYRRRMDAFGSRELDRIVGTLAPGPALEVQIWEERVKVRDEGTRVQWLEQSRRVSHEPFYVIDDRGVSVRVEPSASLQLMAPLEVVSAPSLTRRERIARIAAGNRVEVHGHLIDGYDPSGDNYPRQSVVRVLRPPANGRVVVSLGSTVDTLRPLARFHLRWAAALLLCWMALMVATLGPFVVLRAVGREVMATVKYCEQTEDEGVHGGTFYRYHLFAAIDQSECPGKPVDDDTNEETYRRAHGEHGLKVPFIVAANCRIYQLGPRASVSWGLLVWLIIGSLPIGMLYMHYAQKKKPWYLQTRTVEEIL